MTRGRAGGAPALDIVIPVYHEGENIVPVLESLRRGVRARFRVLIAYDRPDDSTLAALRRYPRRGMRIVTVRNPGRGPHAAVRAGFRASRAPRVLVFPADDTFNAPVIDRAVRLGERGADVVVFCRFMPGGRMVGCPWLKAVLVRTAAWTLHRLGGLPTRDATSGLRLFGRRVIRDLPVESRRGFTYSLELTAKVHRLGWRIAEVPAIWEERVRGKSRFAVLRWLPAYLRWYAYVFATTWGRRSPDTVPRAGRRTPRAGRRTPRA